MSNLKLLTSVCSEIEPILDQVVLVGGCATELLITDPAAPEVRYTADVDMLIEVISLNEYYQIGKTLKNMGFKESQELVCRWKKDDLILDLMPTNEKVLGFSNIWYQEALMNCETKQIDSMIIRHASAPYFLATKLEAFITRGNSDFLSSHDLEDIISVIDGREEITTEVLQCNDKLKNYIQKQFSLIIKNDDFIETIPGFLPPDLANQSRVKILTERINSLAHLKL
ncbi:MAG: hypothetical protein HQL46_13255 [Gammaproteobacteria bacterium]|nr:hypothetical protein [Gammaproteobacteria bacterium]